jgi:hypothetical protein
MKRTALSLAALIAFSVPVASYAQAVAPPNAISFTARVTTPSGNPVPDGNYTIRIRFYDAETAGNVKYEQTFTNTPVKNGVIAVVINQFTAETFNDTLWMAVKIGTDAELSPRSQIVSVPYAIKSNLALTVPDGSLTASKFAAGLFDSQSWRLGGNSGVTSGFLGTTDEQPLEFRVNGRRAVRYQYVENLDSVITYLLKRSINTLGGSPLNQISSGIVGATIAGGGGQEEDLGNNFISEHPNIVQADYGTIGGGFNNIVSDRHGTVSGGLFNRADGYAATVAGGAANSANGSHTFAVGLYNFAVGDYSAVTGGYNNRANNNFAFVGNGQSNQSTALYAVIGGGFSNLASGERSFVGGGGSNTASHLNATIGGGVSNTAGGTASTVGGGSTNTANGDSATVSGGFSNSAAGKFSFAAGGRASALHDGAFVWKSFDDTVFSSSGVNQFLISAAGGVGINTNNPDGYALNVNGASFANGGVFNSGNTAVRGNGGSHGIFGTGSTGVRGEGGSAGVYGKHTNGNYGVLGGSSYGVYGEGVTGSYAGRFKGDVRITDGTLQVNAITYTSDARYKTNISTLDNALNTILNLRGVGYDWNRSEWKNFPEGKQIGFIAQEVEKILPELVSTDKDGYKSVAYANVVPVLVEAVKTLNAKTVQQQKRFEALERSHAASQKENAELRESLSNVLRRLEAIENAKR